MNKLTDTLMNVNNFFQIITKLLLKSLIKIEISLLKNLDIEVTPLKIFIIPMNWIVAVYLTTLELNNWFFVTKV